MAIALIQSLITALMNYQIVIKLALTPELEREEKSSKIYLNGKTSNINDEAAFL